MNAPQIRQGRRDRRAMIQGELVPLSGESSPGPSPFDELGEAGIERPELSPISDRSSLIEDPRASRAESIERHG